MSSEDRLLKLLEDAIVQHGGDLGGWTKRETGSLQLFDGRVTLRAKVDDHQSDSGQSVPGLVHTHIYATLHEHDDEVLDACVYGMADDAESALAQASVIWMTCVAGPIKSFIDGNPVCMTCQAGVQGGDPSEGFAQGDYGLPGLRAYVGPVVWRAMKDGSTADRLDDTKPWFRYAAESAAPRRVHLAKTTILAQGEKGWQRNLEIDGHDVSHSDPNWPAGISAPDAGYVLRYAVFEFPRNSTEITRRTELERTIRRFVQLTHTAESKEALMAQLEQEGFDPDISHEVESISSLAFGRLFFENRGIEYPTTVIRARENGDVELDVPLMSLPAFSRGRAVLAKMADTLSDEEYQSACFWSAESGGLLQIFEAHPDIDLSNVTLYPCVVPDRNVSDETMDTALATLQRVIDENKQNDQPAKPWWKFW